MIKSEFNFLFFADEGMGVEHVLIVLVIGETIVGSVTSFVARGGVTT